MLILHGTRSLIITLWVVTSFAGCVGTSPSEPDLTAPTEAPPGTVLRDPAGIRNSVDIDEEVRPFVVAVFEYGLPYVEHPELVLEYGEQEARRLSAGVPDATTNYTLEQVGREPLLTNTFIRFNGSKIIGAFHGTYDGMGEPHPMEQRDHVTATSGRVVATDSGVCPECLVVVGTEITVGFAWAYHQEWIDAISLSIGGPGTNAIGELPLLIENITQSGKPVFLANGNFPDHSQYDDGLYTSDAIVVNMMRADGRVEGTYPNGADIAAPGEGRVLDQDGHRHGRGTSHSAPYAAGMWGRFLMDAWERGSLERVVEDGRVRNKVLADPVPEHPAFADGYLDATEALDVIGGFADPDPPVGILDHGSNYPEPSFWVGYGALDEQRWVDIRAAWDEGFPPTPAPGPGHTVHLNARDGIERVSTARWHVVCGALNLYWDSCSHHYLENDDWYQ